MCVCRVCVCVCAVCVCVCELQLRIVLLTKKVGLQRAHEHFQQPDRRWISLQKTATAETDYVQRPAAETTGKNTALFCGTTNSAIAYFCQRDTHSVTHYTDQHFRSPPPPPPHSTMQCHCCVVWCGVVCVCVCLVKEESVCVCVVCVCVVCVVCVLWCVCVCVVVWCG